MYPHSPSCSGCPTCDPVMRWLLTATPEEHCRWLNAQPRLRTASHGTLKTNIRYHQEDIVNYAPPDSYAAAVSEMRAAAQKTASPFEEQYRAMQVAAMNATRKALDQERECIFPRASAEELRPYRAPNSYALALEKQERRR